jgi:hypothetical protein
MRDWVLSAVVEILTADGVAGARVREFIIDRVRRCVDARIIAGDPTDIAHVLIGLSGF